MQVNGLADSVSEQAESVSSCKEMSYIADDKGSNRNRRRNYYRCRRHGGQRTDAGFVIVRIRFSSTLFLTTLVERAW